MATPTKRPSRARTATKAVKAGSSPTPGSMNSTCGHSSCGTNCNVRYCGPTSPMHNQHIIHAARGAMHVWAAAIVAGLAVVLTGSIAYTAVHAEEQMNDPTTLMLLSLRRIEMRLDRMEPKLNRLIELSQKAPMATSTDMGAKMGEKDKMAKPPVNKAECAQKCKALTPGDDAATAACYTAQCLVNDKMPAPTSSDMMQ